MTMSLLTPEEQKAAEVAPEYAVAPEGIYICRVGEVARWKTGETLVWKFKVAKGQPLAGKEFWTWTGLKPDTIGFTKTYLTALGFGLDADPRDIKGTPCKVQIAIEFDRRPDHAGEKQNRVKKVFAYDGPALPGEYDDSDIPAEFGDPDEQLI
jgi:hypothetical protein